MIKFTSLFKKVPILTLMAEELHEAQVNLLISQTGLEYSKSMVDYHRARIDRLKKSMEEATKKQE